MIEQAHVRAAELMDGLRESQQWQDGAMILGLASELAVLEDRMAAIRAWIAKVEPYPELNGNLLRELRGLAG